MADYIEIKDLVNDIMLTLGEDNYDKGQKYHQLELIALQGLKELNFEVNQEIKTVQATVDSTLSTLAFPSDAIKITKIGVMGSDGEIHPLALENRLSLDNSFEATSNEGTILDADNNPYYQSYVGFNQYGIGGASNVHGYYRIDRDSQQIQFSSHVSGKKVVLEYISNGLSNGIIPGANRIVEITCPAQDGNYIDGFDNFLNLRYFDSVLSSEINWRLEFTFDTTTTVGYEDFLLLGTGFTAEQTATALYNSIQVRSPHHSATISGDKVTITYTDQRDWAGVESTGPMVAGFTFNTTQGGSAKSGSSTKTCPQFAEEALRSYIYWKSIQRKRGVPLGEKQIAKKDFYNQKRLARARSQSFSKDEALYASRKNFKQSPKL